MEISAQNVADSAFGGEFAISKGGIGCLLGGYSQCTRMLCFFEFADILVVFDEPFCLDISKFARQPKLKPFIKEDRQVLHLTCERGNCLS